MPFIINQEDEEKKNQAQNISGTSNVINPNQTANPSPKGTDKKSSGSFVNLQSYLDANKENTKSMADTISGGITDQAEKTINAGQLYNSATPATIKSYSNDDIKNSFYVDPSKADKTQYDNIKNTGGYSGPTSYEKINGYQDFSDNYGKAVNKLNQIDTEVGRQNLVKEQYARPSYSQGQSLLDQTLLQNDSYAKEKMLGTKNKYKDLFGMLDSTTKTAGDNINQNILTAAANKNQLNKSESDYMNQFMAPINERIAPTNALNQSIINKYQEDIKNNLLTPEELSQFGLTAGQQTYGVDLNSYLNPNYTQSTVDNVASSEERAKYAALQSLMDKSDGLITTEGKAINPATFNTDQFNKDVASKKAEVENIAANTPISNDSNSSQLGSVKNFMDSGKTPQQYVDDIFGPIGSFMPEKQQAIRQRYIDSIYNFLRANNTSSTIGTGGASVNPDNTINVNGGRTITGGLK